MSRDFEWSGLDVVLRAYGSVAVHENPYGDIVIRQERDALEDEDQFVVVPVHDAALVAQAIIDKAEEIRTAAAAPSEPEQPEQRLALTAPTSSNAARQGELIPHQRRAARHG